MGDCRTQRRLGRPTPILLRALAKAFKTFESRLHAEAVAGTVTAAERDGGTSHGLFRIPGYVTALRSGKVNGRARPKAEGLAPATLRLDGDGGFALSTAKPLAAPSGVYPRAGRRRQCPLRESLLTKKRAW